jgi:hypothetical protein
MAPIFSMAASSSMTRWGQEQAAQEQGPTAGAAALLHAVQMQAFARSGHSRDSCSPCLPHSCRADVDISYSPKPLWESYLRFIEDGGADMAGAAEGWGSE